MRVGELTYQANHYGKEFIANKDLKMDQNQFTIILHHTKTDLENKGVLKIIGNVGNIRANPFILMRNLRFCKLSSTKPTDPFFALKDGKPVTRNMLVRFLQGKMARIFPKIPKKEWTGISLRKGGATSAMRAGVQGDVISKLGHWKSNVYLKYIHHGDRDIKAAQKKMAFRAASTKTP